MFVKAEDFVPDNPNLIKRNEPIFRGGRSKPHICGEVYTVGGKEVYVHPTYAPNGVSYIEMVKIKQRLKEQDFSGIVNFDSSTRNARIYIRGKVKHPDHNTIHLLGWHWVLMNTGNESKASWASVFLD
ncbi:MAG: hypothetical protein HF978_06670 [Desulfobacteraceae bacterium]|nr:hypothetical protein [Desulfobacteraceae bacterium]MBC2755215.1 hypothetical protein [Desulfobacteraceae bacterium]